MKMILLIALLAIGGINAKPPKSAGFGESILMEDPWYFVKILRNEKYKCAGALISDRHVLTVAHCVVDEFYKRYSNLMVASGTLKKDDKGSLHEIQYVIHPREFKRAPEEEMEADIAVLVLTARIRFHGNEEPVPLPSKMPLYNIRSRERQLSPKAELITFKYEDHSDDASLYKVATAVYPNNKCFEGGFSFDDTPDVFCGVNNRDELSHIDDGSPLIQDGGVVGIATVTRPENLFRSNYVNVYKYKRFIRQVMFEPDHAGVML